MKRTAITRRRVLAVGAGTVALGAGLGALWCRPRLSQAERALWELSAQRPKDGDAPLRLASFQGSRLVLNFWATWCAPCLQELPMLSQFQAEHGQQGWQVVGLAVDQREAVSRFLGRVPVQFPVGIVGSAGLDLMPQLGNAGGGLPFTVALNRQGAIAQRKIGQLSSSDLKLWLRELV